MEPKMIDAFGKLLFGDRYVSALAEACSVARHTVIGWVNGDWACPDHQAEKIKTMAKQRVVDINNALRSV